MQKDLALELKEVEMEREYYRRFLETEALKIDEEEQQRLDKEIAEVSGHKSVQQTHFLTSQTTNFKTKIKLA